MAYPDWARLLNPANGGPGEAPGYQDTIDQLRNNPWGNPQRRASRTKDTRDRYPGLKHGAD